MLKRKFLKMKDLALEYYLFHIIIFGFLTLLTNSGIETRSALTGVFVFGDLVVMVLYDFLIVYTILLVLLGRLNSSNCKFVYNKIVKYTNDKQHVLHLDIIRMCILMFTRLVGFITEMNYFNVLGGQSI